MSDVTETSLVVIAKRGRPRALEPRTSVSTWLTASEADRLIRLANEKEMSVSSLVRLVLTTRLKKTGTP